MGASMDDPLQGLHDPVGHLLAPGDAAEDVDEDGPDLGVGVDDLEGVGHDLGVGAAADVEEVGRRPADLVDHVAGAHGQAGPVGDDAHVAVEPDVLQALRTGQPLALVELVDVTELVPLGMAEGGVVVQGHLGVEGVHLAVGREDQRVDLDQVGVAFDVAAVQVHQDGHRPVPGLGVQAGLVDQAAGVGLGEPDRRIDVHAGDGRRVLLGHRFDLDAALGRHHGEVLLGRPVEGEAGVVLLGDVRGVLDPQAVHDVALDVEAEDVAGVQAHLVGVGGQLDAAGLPPPADLHLGLDDDRVAGLLGCGHRLIDGVGDAAGGHRDAVAGEVLLALVFEQIHARS